MRERDLLVPAVVSGAVCCGTMALAVGVGGRPAHRQRVLR